MATWTDCTRSRFSHQKREWGFVFFKWWKRWCLWRQKS